MSRRTQGLLVFLIGAVGVRLVLQGNHLNYLKDRMTAPLLITSIVLVVLGVTTLLSAGFGSDPGVDGDDHGHGRLVAWLLTAPIVVVALIAPAPLGSDAVDTTVGSAPTQGRTPQPPLESADSGPVELELNDYVNRALYDSNDSLDGVPVRLVGFVSPDDSGRFDALLTRFALSCCAADGYPIQVGLGGLAETPAADTWIEVVGVTDATGADDERAIPSLEVTSVSMVDAPANPYL